MGIGPRFGRVAIRLMFVQGSYLGTAPVWELLRRVNQERLSERIVNEQPFYAVFVCLWLNSRGTWS